MKFYTTSKISENIHETPEGYLVCVGVAIARTGEMIYGEGETPLEVGPDGKIVINRYDDEVFRPETMASFEGKAVTIQHPNEFVSPENWSKLAKGILQNVRRGEGDQSTDLIADLLITDSQAIELVKNGLREVSCGYEAEYSQTGEGQGIQQNIVGNHLALVDEGRAGSAYAINDHKGKGFRMKLKDKIIAILAKAQDEALKMVGDADDMPEKKEDKKDMGFDELVKAVKDLGEKVGAMAPKKQEDAEPEKKAEEKPAAKDEEKPKEEEKAKDEEVAPSLEARLDKLEALVSKLLEGESMDSDGESDEGGESMDDAEGDDVTDEESCDDGDEESEMTGDSVSRVEILAPGLKAQGKDIRVKALKVAYGTTDGKAVIHQITGGKTPDFKDEKFVETLFIATSEILKGKRSSDLSKTKTRDFQPAESGPQGPMSAEKINEMNAKHYGLKK